MKNPPTTKQPLTLRQQLDIVFPALADEKATQVGARMVQVWEGRLWAYGGEMCISVPTSLDLSAAFFPNQVLNWFSVPRKGVTFTDEKKHLVIRDADKDYIKVDVMPRENVELLQVFGDAMECEDLHRDNLKFASALADPDADQVFSRGVFFRGGAVWAGSGVNLFSGASGLSPAIPEFMLKRDSVKVLASQKGKLKAVIIDTATEYAVEFIFDDGVHIACRRLECTVPNIASVFEQKILSTLDLPEKAMTQITAMRCKRWGFSSAVVTYFTDPGDERIKASEGAILCKTGLNGKEFPNGVYVDDKFLKKGVKLGGNVIHISAVGLFFYGESCVYAVSQMRQPAPVVDYTPQPKKALTVVKPVPKRPALNPNDGQLDENGNARYSSFDDEDEIPF